MPADPLNSWIFPSAPTGTTTRFGMFCPAWKFRFDVCCLVVPEGHTVMNPAAFGLTAVTFTTTADTPLAGTPPWPVTCRDTVPSAGDRAGDAAGWSRVSMIRAGASEATAPGSGRGAGDDVAGDVGEQLHGAGGSVEQLDLSVGADRDDDQVRDVLPGLEVQVRRLLPGGARGPHRDEPGGLSG